MKKVILLITDGIGYSPQKEFNAFYNAKKPTYDCLFANVPYGMVKTSGLSVGLPDRQMGNSEVGHMSIGSGRVLYQDLVKISLSLKDGSLKKDEKLNSFLNSSSDIHVIGLVSDGGVHSHIEHIIGVANIAKEVGKKVYVHVITDGRDVSPTSAISYIDMIKAQNLEIATVSGRFYAMDRDNRWERVEKAYRAYEGANGLNIDICDYIKEQYSKNITDEFIEPASFNGFSGIKDGDGVLFANFRSDRAREIVKALGEENFSEFKRNFKKINLITMTEYDSKFTFPILFPKDSPKNTLAEVISQAGLRQLHTSETEKYAHVTFFFNGGVEEPFANETRVLVPSPKVKTYDLAPSMSVVEIADNIIKGVESGYDFIVANFANGDMVGHTGVYDAGVMAVEAVDKEIGRVLEKSREHNYSFILTSDHGNCEEMRTINGETLTNHTIGEVWCFVDDSRVQNVSNGGLNNIAPTVLKLMGLEIPKEMDEPLILL